MEAELVHGEGDLAGEPFRLAGHELRVLYRLHEYDPDTGLYLHDKALIGWPKGSGKTEFVAGMGLEGLVGPTAPKLPSIPVAAATKDQAGELVRIAGLMTEDQDIRGRLEVQQQRILIPGPNGQDMGRMFATTASTGPNDGRKPSRLLLDEIHEWDEHSTAGAKRHAILARGLRKRSNAQQINITTAGWNLETLAGKMYTFGCQVAAGKIAAPRFLFEWYEASDEHDLEDAEQLLAAVLEANPAAGLFWPAEGLVQEYHEHKLRGEVEDFLRYHLNRWVPLVRSAWLDMKAWHARADTRDVACKTRIALGFDGSKSGDSTALIGATIASHPHVFVIGHWERPAGLPDAEHWEVPVLDVEAAIEAACGFYKVEELAADTSYWRSSLARLLGRGVPVVDVPQSSKRMAPACQRLFEGVTRAEMTHDGDSRLARHTSNCRGLETLWGNRIVKEHLHSKRQIDLTVAAVLAHEAAARIALSSSSEGFYASLV